MKLITPDQLKHLRELEAKASEPNWVADTRVRYDLQDMIFIAESRNILPALLSSYEKLLAVYEAAKNLVHHGGWHCEDSLVKRLKALDSEESER